MSVLQECPACRQKQSVKNKLCKCGEDLVKAKKSQRVKYWISYRMPDGKQRRESVSAFEDLNGCSIEDARDALSKRQVQKRENRIFDMLPESKMTFKELSEWYLNLTDVKGLASYRSIGVYLNSFNKIHGDRIVGDLKREDLKRHQSLRENQGLKPATIDQEICHVKKAVTEAFYNDKLDGRTLKAFKGLENKLKRGSNARKRTISFDEYLTLVDSATPHFKPVLIVAYHTGMRSGELQKLQWSHVDRKEMFLRLPGEITKTGDPRDIPMNHHVKSALDALPRSINHNFVFTFRNKPFTHKNGFVHSLKSTCEKAGLPYGRNVENGITMHDTRRTLKTNMLSAGIDKVYRDKILGHSLQGMDVHYLAPTEDTLKSQMECFTQWLDDRFGEASQMLTKTLTKAG